MTLEQINEEIALAEERLAQCQQVLQQVAAKATFINGEIASLKKVKQIILNGPTKSPEQAASEERSGPGPSKESKAEKKSRKKTGAERSPGDS